MSNQIKFELPSPETLEGIYVLVEGQEDLTVRPKQIKPAQVGAQQGNGAAESAVSDRPETAPGDQEKRPRGN
jgi:hypothetical protein